MSRGFLKAIRVESVEELKSRINQYINLLNEEPVVFLWKYKIEGEDKILVEFQYERNMQLIWNRCTSFERRVKAEHRRIYPTFGSKNTPTYEYSWLLFFAYLIEYQCHTDYFSNTIFRFPLF